MAGTDIGRRIAAARRERGLTQEELAERIGVMLGTLEAYEGGSADPSRHLDRISAATGREALWFLRGDPLEDMAALLRRHAAQLGKRESELALASERIEARLRELSRRQHHANDRAPEQALTHRERAVTQAEADPFHQGKALDDRPSTFEEEKRRFEEARAEREQRLVDLLERVRTVAAQLHARGNEGDIEVEADRPPVEADALRAEWFEADASRVPVDEAVAEPQWLRKASRRLLVVLLAVLAPPLVIGTAVYVLEGSGGEAVPQVGIDTRASPPSPFPRASLSPTPRRSPTQRRTGLQPPVRLVLVAALGESWVEAHARSPAGPILFRGTLTSGRELRLSGQRLWIRLGAATNLAFTLNGRRTGAQLQGTVDVLVTPQGIQRT